MPRRKIDVSDAWEDANGKRQTIEEKVRIDMRFDPSLLKRIDVSAEQQGITRTAWLHIAAFKALKRS